MKLFKGEKFNITRTSPFGKKINETVTVVAIFKNSVLMDNGKQYHLTNF